VKRGVYGVSFGTSGYHTRGYGVSTIIRKRRTDAAATTDTQTSLRAATINTTAAYNTSHYQSTSYNS